MRYLGGKSKVAKHLAPKLREALAWAGGRWVEPFTGGFNMVPALADAITWGDCSDLHPGVITLWRAVQAGTFEPPDALSEAEFDWLKIDGDWTNPLTAFAAFGCTFGASEFNTYARAPGTGRNFAAESRRAILKKRAAMARITFACRPYATWEADLAVRPPSVVYCDPPYAGTEGYRIMGTEVPWDREAFAAWATRVARQGHAVFISEFTSPLGVANWRPVWMRARKVGLDERRTVKIETMYQVDEKVAPFFGPEATLEDPILA